MANRAPQRKPKVKKPRPKKSPKAAPTPPTPVVLAPLPDSPPNVVLAANGFPLPTDREPTSAELTEAKFKNPSAHGFDAIGRRNYQDKTPEEMREIMEQSYIFKYPSERSAKTFTVTSRLTVERIAQALRLCGGNITEVARCFGKHRNTIAHQIQRHPELKEIMLEMREAIIDEAELKMREAVSQGQPWAIRTTLSMIGKHRGWTEKHEVSIEGIAPPTITEVTIVHNHLSLGNNSPPAPDPAGAATLEDADGADGDETGGREQGGIEVELPSGAGPRLGIEG